MLSYKERQARWLKENKVVLGDIVRVCFAVPSNFSGWPRTWIKEMNSYIGNFYPILEINDWGFAFQKKGFWFPYFCLELSLKEEKEETEEETFSTETNKDLIVFPDNTFIRKDFVGGIRKSGSETGLIIYDRDGVRSSISPEVEERENFLKDLLKNW